MNRFAGYPVEMLSWSYRVNFDISHTSYATKAWQVAFRPGEVCSFQPSGLDQGPAYPRLSQFYCWIPNLGYTHSFDFEMANGDYTYTLGLHKTDDCTNSRASYQSIIDLSKTSLQVINIGTLNS